MKSNNFVVIQGWMCNELDLKGNELLVFALIHGFSQDGESLFRGSREYIADTFNISKPTVDKTLSSLVSKNYLIKIESDDFSTPNAYAVNIDLVKKLYMGGKETLLGGSKETLLNKTSNKKESKKENSSTKVLLGNSDSEISFLGSISETKSEKPKKKNLYERCIDMISAYTDDVKLQGLLITYLNYRLEIKDKPLYANMWKGMLKKLESLDENDCELACAIVQQSINRGYLGFFPVNTYSRSTSLHDKLNESGATNVPHITADEEAELERMVMSGELQEY